MNNIENQPEINQQIKRKNSFIENAFKCELKKPAYSNLNSKDYLKLIINNYLKENENVDTYHGPYSVICQSSGFGKSRACLSLKDDFYIVYICLRDSCNLRIFCLTSSTTSGSAGSDSSG